MNCVHEYKSCPRCQAPFECRVGNISSCQCNAVALTADERNFIQDHFDDCLCGRCMTEMKQEFINKEFTRKLKNIIGQGH